MLTPNFLATSRARTNCRMGRASIATGVMRFSWSLPFKRFIAPPRRPYGHAFYLRYWQDSVKCSRAGRLDTSWRRSGAFKEIDCDAMSLRRDWRTGDLGVEGGDGGMQALGDHLGVMLERSLRVRVPQVPL